MTNEGCLRMRTVVWIVIIALLLFSLFIIRKVLDSSETWECNVSHDSITDKVEAEYLTYQEPYRLVDLVFYDLTDKNRPTLMLALNSEEIRLITGTDGRRLQLQRKYGRWFSKEGGQVGKARIGVSPTTRSVELAYQINSAGQGVFPLPIKIVEDMKTGKELRIRVRTLHKFSGDWYDTFRIPLMGFLPALEECLQRDNTYERKD